jgi:hypothetical protein
MSRRQIIECDRCGSIGDEDTDREDRGRVYAATLTGTDKVGTSESPADLCGGCMHDLWLFMNGGDPAPAGPRRDDA